MSPVNARSRHDLPAEIGRHRADEPPTVMPSSMDLAGPSSRAGSSGARTTRVVRGLSAVVAVLLVASSWFFWTFSKQTLGLDHWDAVRRGRADLRAGRADLAIQAVSVVRDEAPGAGEAMTVAGLALARLGEYRAARQALERALKLQPDQFDAALALAELNFGLGNGERGLEVLRIAARLRPREFRVWLAMGKVLHDRGDVPGAIQAYERALGLNPSHREALIGLIGTLMASVQPEQAGPWVARALQKYPDDPAILGLAARAASDADRADEALGLADRALALDPQNFHALLARAAARSERGRWADALRDAQLASDRYPNDMSAFKLLLKIEARLGLGELMSQTQLKRRKAQERLRLMNQLAEEISLHPEDPVFPWRMGRAAEESGMIMLASRCFLAALALDPNYKSALESLAALRETHPELANLSDQSARSPITSLIPPSSSLNSP